MKNLRSILARTGAVCLLVLLVGLSGLLGCKVFKNDSKETAAIRYLVLGGQDPGEASATVTFWLENTGISSKTVTIAEYGVPSPSSVTVEAEGINFRWGVNRVKTEVRLTCFVPVDGGGNGTLQLQVGIPRYSAFLTVQRQASGTASVSPDLVQLGGD